jgi:hypothetical protein
VSNNSDAPVWWEMLSPLLFWWELALRQLVEATLPGSMTLTTRPGRRQFADVRLNITEESAQRMAALIREARAGKSAEANARLSAFADRIELLALIQRICSNEEERRRIRDWPMALGRCVTTYLSEPGVSELCVQFAANRLT